MGYIEFDKIDGLYTQAQRRIAEVIRDVFPNVRLIRLDALHPSFTPERPFALVDEPKLIGRDLPSYVIRTVAEYEIDARLLAELIENNTYDPNATVNRLDILEMAQAAIKAKQEVEYMEERRDVMKSIMKSKKHEYKHDGKVLKR
jgi:hypothetical protein